MEGENQLKIRLNLLQTRGDELTKEYDGLGKYNRVAAFKTVECFKAIKRYLETFRKHLRNDAQHTFIKEEDSMES